MDDVTKRCSRCGRDLPLDMFHKDKKSSTGLSPRCKACHAELKGQKYTGRVQKRFDAPEGYKGCIRCEQIKPLSDFHRSPAFKDGYRTICKACVSKEAGREYRPPAPEGQKWCSRCKQFKPCTEEFFYPSKQGAKGFRSPCIECTLSTNNQYRKENRDEVLEGKKRYRLENPEKIREQFNNWKAANQEHVQQYNQEYYQKNRERIRSEWHAVYQRDREDYLRRSREWNLNNRDRVRERSRRWRQSNPEVARKKYNDWRAANPAKARLIYHRRHMRKLSLPFAFTDREWLIALDYWNNRCAVCGRSPENDLILAMDHWIPLFHPECPGTVVTNMLPLCHGTGGCNNKKNDSPPAEWLIRELGQEAAAQKLTEISSYFDWISKLTAKETVNV